MKKFAPEMKVVRFGAEDVIATSGKTITLSNFSDGNRSNNTFTFGGKSYDLSGVAHYMYSNRVQDDIFPNMATYFEDNNFNKAKVTDVYFDDVALNTFYLDNNGVQYASMNGTYTYAGNLKFTKQ